VPRGLALSLLLLPRLLAAQAGPLPFYGSEAEFLADLKVGHFDPQLDLHQLEYRADLNWFLDWTAARNHRSGLLGEFGSITSRQIFASFHLAAQAQATEQLQVRYDRRLFNDGRFERRSERLEAWVSPGGTWAVGLAGWPAPLKEQASLGVGLRLGAPAAGNTMSLMVVDERALWNEKTDTPVRYTARPRRFLVDAALAGAPGGGVLRAAFTADWQTAFRAREEAPGGLAPPREAMGFQRSLEGDGEFRMPTWAVGARVAWAARAHEERSATGPLLSLDRSFLRVLLQAERTLGPTRLLGLVAHVRTQDAFVSGTTGPGRYDERAWLAGLEAARPLRPGLEVRLGGLASRYRMRREAALGMASTLPPGGQEGTTDKVHAKLLWTLRPGASIQFLLSQTLHGDSFGGGAISARLVF